MTQITASVPASILNSTNVSWRSRIHVMPDGYRAVVTCDGTNIAVKTSASGGSWSAATNIIAQTGLTALIDTVVVGNALHVYIASGSSINCTILPYTGVGAWGVAATTTPITAIPYTAGSLRAVFDPLGTTSDTQHNTGATGLVHLLVDAGPAWYLYALDPYTAATAPKLVLSGQVSTGITTPSYNTNLILRQNGKLYALTSQGANGWRGCEIDYVGTTSTTTALSYPAQSHAVDLGGTALNCWFAYNGAVSVLPSDFSPQQVYQGRQIAVASAGVEPPHTAFAAGGYGISFPDLGSATIPAGVWTWSMTLVSAPTISYKLFCQLRVWELTAGGTRNFIGTVGAQGGISVSGGVMTASGSFGQITLGTGSSLYIEPEIVLNNPPLLTASTGGILYFTTATLVTPQPYINAGASSASYSYVTGSVETPGLPVSVYGAALSVAGADSANNPVDIFVTQTGSVGYMQRNIDGSYTALQSLTATGISTTAAPSACSDQNGNTSVFAEGTFSAALHVGILKKTGGIWGAYAQQDTSAAAIQPNSFTGAGVKSLGKIGSAIAYVNGPNPYNLQYEDSGYTSGTAAPAVGNLILVPTSSSSNDVFGLSTPFNTATLAPFFQFQYLESLSNDLMSSVRFVVTRTDIGPSTVWDSGQVTAGKVVHPGDLFSIQYGTIGAAATALVAGGTYTVVAYAWEGIAGTVSAVSATTTFTVISAPVVTPTAPGIITNPLQAFSFNYGQQQSRPMQSYQIQLLDTTGIVQYDSGNIPQVVAVGANYATTVTGQTPLIYWRLGETSGTAAADSASGGTHAGLYVNAVLNQPTVLGDGNPSISINHNGKAMSYTAATGVPSGAAARSVTLLFKTTDTVGAQIAGWGTQDTNKMFGLQVHASGKMIVIWGWGSGQDGFFNTATYNDGLWHHLAVTNDGTTTKVYLDGIASAGQAHTFNTVIDANGVVLGSDPQGGNSYSGNIDEVAIWTRALTAAEVTAEYQAQSTYRNLIMLQSPLIYYRLDESTGTIVTDSSGNGRNGVYGTGVTLSQTGHTSDGDKAVLLNAGAAKVTYASGAGLPAGNAARSVEVFINPLNSGTFGTLWSWGGTASGTEFGIRVSAATTLIVMLGTTTYNFTVPNMVTNGTWRHLVVTYNPTSGQGGGTGSIEVWVDSVSQGKVTVAPLNTTATNLQLGCDTSNANNYSGTLDEFVIYDHVLAPSDIAAHFLQTPTTSFTTPALNISGKVLNLANYTAKVTAFATPAAGGAYSASGSMATSTSLPTTPPPTGLTAAPTIGGGPTSGGYVLLNWNQLTDNLVANGGIQLSGTGSGNFYIDPFVNGAGWDTVTNTTFASNIATLGATTGLLGSQTFFYANQSLAVRFLNNASATTKLDLRFMFPGTANSGYVLRINATGTPSIQFQKLVTGTATALGSNITATLTASTWYWAIISFNVNNGATYMSATIYNDVATSIGTTVIGTISAFSDTTYTAVGAVGASNLGAAAQQIGGRPDGLGFWLIGPTPASWSARTPQSLTQVWGGWFVDTGSLVLAARQVTADAGAFFTWTNTVASIGVGSTALTAQASIKGTNTKALFVLNYTDASGNALVSNPIMVTPGASYALLSGTDPFVPATATQVSLSLTLGGSVGLTKADSIQLEGGTSATGYRLQAGATLVANKIYTRQTGATGWTLVATIPSVAGAAYIKDYWVPLGLSMDYSVTSVNSFGYESAGSQVLGVTLNNRVGWWLNDPNSPGNAIELGLLDMGDQFPQLEPIQDKSQDQLFNRQDMVITVGSLYSFHIPEVVFQLEQGYEAACLAQLQTWDQQGTVLQLRSPWGDVLSSAIVASKQGARHLSINRSVAIEFQGASGSTVMPVSL